jgi:pyruvate kinase
MGRTRVVATIGPASDSDEIIRALVDGGLDVARLNYSHGDHAGKNETYQRLRRIEAESGRPLGILADLPGPKLRLGRFEGHIDLVRGEEIDLVCGREEGLDNGLPVAWGGLSADLKVDDPILLADGLVRLRVISTPNIPDSRVTCVVEDGGKMTQRKGINVPSTMVDLPAVGPYDKECLAHALSLGVDFVAVSYVRTPEDLIPAKEMIEKAGVHTWIIAKIEHPSALKHLTEIVDMADVVMVARGDLGVEIPMEQVPAAQEKIVLTCLQRGKPVIVATQMLESMVENPRPTRAEVSDVATAIRQGASGIMLSGETAGGDHPIAALQTMVKIATAVDEVVSELPPPPALATYKSTRAVAGAAVQLARDVNANHIIVATEHGNAAKLVAAYRPDMPVTAMTDRIRAARRTTILPGVHGIVVEQKPRARDTVASATAALFADGRLHSGDIIVAVSGSPEAITGRTSSIRMLQIGDEGLLNDL